MSDRIDQWLRRWLIRGRDPRDPAASKNGLKTEVYLLTVGSLFAGAVVVVALDLSLGPGGAVAGIVAFLVFRRVIRVVNRVGREWDARTQIIRSRARVGRDDREGSR